jgi:hypothetical protein
MLARYRALLDDWLTLKRARWSKQKSDGLPTYQGMNFVACGRTAMTLENLSFLSRESTAEGVYSLVVHWLRRVSSAACSCGSQRLVPCLALG